MKAQFMVLERFVLYNFVSSVLKRSKLYLTYKFKMSVVPYIITLTMSILLNMLTII